MHYVGDWCTFILWCTGQKALNCDSGYANASLYYGMCTLPVFLQPIAFRIALFGSSGWECLWGMFLGSQNWRPDSGVAENSRCREVTAVGRVISDISRDLDVLCCLATSVEQWAPLTLWQGVVSHKTQIWFLLTPFLTRELLFWLTC